MNRWVTYPGEKRVEIVLQRRPLVLLSKEEDSIQEVLLPCPFNATPFFLHLTSIQGQWSHDYGVQYREYTPPSLLGTSPWPSKN